MALDLSALEAEVTRDDQVNSSASTLITKLADAYEAVKGDPAAISALTARIKAQSDALAQAVAANTPSEGGGGTDGGGGGTGDGGGGEVPPGARRSR